MLTFSYFYDTKKTKKYIMRKKYQKIVAHLIIGITTVSFSFSQVILDNSAENIRTIACELPVTDYVNKVYVPPSDFVRSRLENRVDNCANIEVTYNGFPFNISNPLEPGPEEAAFQFAVDIWETLLDTPVTIRINANYTPLGATTLGNASAAFFSEIPGGEPNTLYPAALAEKLVGTELNGAESIDINCNFNSQFANWYFGTDGNTPGTDFDFVSVVLHELGHGLGVAGFGIRIGNNASNFQGNIRRSSTGLTLPPNAQFHSIWDTFIDGPDIFLNPIPILNETNFPDPSNIMLAAFTSDNLTCNSPLAIQENGGVAPKTFAPSTFNPGSTYSHWDESTFNGTPNALMTPQFGRGEAIHDPGTITLGFMEDMGWSLCQGSLSTNEFDISSVTISPNPFTNAITLNLPASLSNDTFNVSLIDINGRVILNQTPQNINGELTISDLSNLEASLYFLTIESTTSNISITKKIVKN